jgi:hypothetical protein
MATCDERDSCPDEAAAALSSFHRMLRWLDAGAESHGARYVEMRRRLIAFFDRHDRPAPVALADETFRRIARTLDLGAGTDGPPARHCYVVATGVMSEDMRRRGRQIAEEHRPSDPVRSADVERRLRELPVEDRRVLVDHYRDAGRAHADHRGRLAERARMTPAALSARATGIRESLMREFSAASK